MSNSVFEEIKDWENSGPPTKTVPYIKSIRPTGTGCGQQVWPHNELEIDGIFFKVGEGAE